MGRGRPLFFTTIHRRRMMATTQCRLAYALRTELSTFHTITTATCKCDFWPEAQPQCIFKCC